MLFSFEEIKKITTGAIRFEEKDGYLHFSRFTKKQEEYNTERGQDIKNSATSSMTFSFHTDASRISFDYKIFDGSSRKFYGIDAVVDGVLVESICEDTVDTEGHFEFSLKNVSCGKKNKHVCIFLSNLSGCAIKSFYVDGTVTPHEFSEKLLIVGDSITQGYDARHPYITYANMLSYALNAYTLNQAIGGDKFDEKLLDEELPFEPDTVTVAYGVNDWAHCVDIHTNSQAYFKKIKRLYPKAEVYCILPIWYMSADKNDGSDPPRASGLTLEHARDILRKNASVNNITVIESRDFIPHSSDFFADTALHPNDAGFTFYANGIINAIKNSRSI